MHGFAVQDIQQHIESLEKQLERANHERDEYQKLYELVTLELARLRRHIFGQKSEKVDASQMQLAFAEVHKLLKKLGELDPKDNPKPRKNGEKRARPHGRAPLPENLPVERIEINPPETLSIGRKKIGEEVAETLEWRRGGYVRVQVVRPKYVVDGDSGEKKIVVADPPVKPIAKGLAGPGMLARVIVSKFADHLPLHRQSEIFSRDGIHLHPSTLGGWLEPCAELLKPLVEAMFTDAMKAHCIAIDATGVLVQAKEKCRRGHFWVLLADRDHVLFRFSRKHNGATVKSLLPEYRGYLLADAATIYDQLYSTESIVEVGCWAHCRRRFFEALITDSERAKVALELIRRLYDAHDETKSLPPSRRTVARRERAQPVIDTFFQWCDDTALTALPKSPLGEALIYARNQREALSRFLEDGRLRLDNNLAELALRAQAVGRKNWLFVGSDDGAEWNTTFVSLIASCKLHSVEPWTYLRDVMCLLPGWPKNRLLDLSPKSWAQTFEQQDTQERLRTNVFRSVSAGQ